MKKYFMLAAIAAGALSASAVKTADECENLTPYWDFTQATESLKAAAAAGNGTGIFNLNGGGGNWYANNKGNFDFSNGLLVAGSSQAMPAHLEALNNSFQLIDLEGECGKVWCFNYSESNLASKLAENGCEVDLTSGTLGSGAAGNQYHLYFIPSDNVYASGAKLRCRVELNVYHAEGENTPTLHIYAQKDAGNVVDAALTSIATGVWGTQAAYAITPSMFTTDGHWDPTKWMVYDFPITEGTADNHPEIKFQLQDKGLHDHALLIRSIKIYAPYSDGEEVAAITPDALLGDYVSYSVGKEEEEPPYTGPLFNTLPAATSIADKTNLTPELDFTTWAENPIIIGSERPYNSFDTWAKYAEYGNYANGGVVFAYGPADSNGESKQAERDAAAALMAKGVSKVDLGGSAGKVLAINYYGSEFQNVVNEYFACEKFAVPVSENPTSPNLVDFYREYNTAITGAVTVRAEINIYALETASAFRATAHAGGNTYNEVPATGISSEYFLDEDGNWDPTKWVVYEFTCPAVNANGVPTYVKTESPAVTNGTLLIRSITYYQNGDEVLTANKGVVKPLAGTTHSVWSKAVISHFAEDQELVEADMLKDNQKVRFAIPEGHSLWYKVEHDPSCAHKDHSAAAETVNALSDDAAETDAEGYTKVTDEYYTYNAPVAGHSEILSLKAVDLTTGAATFPAVYTFQSDTVTGIDEVGFDGSAAAAELFNLQGVKVDASAAAPGIYIERRGTATRKVVVK